MAEISATIAVAEDLAITAAAIASERVALARHAVAFRAQLPGLIQAGRVSAADIDLLDQRLAAFVDGVLTGLHTGGDPIEVRRAVRAALEDAGLIVGGRAGR